MRALLKKVAAFACVTASVATVYGCHLEKSEQLYLKDFFGAPVTLVISSEHSSSARDGLVGRINSEFEKIEYELSVEGGGSVFRFNAASEGERVEIDGIAYSVMEKALYYYHATGGAFTPSAYKLTDLWGFTSRFADDGYSPSYAYDRERTDGFLPLPKEEYIAAFREQAQSLPYELITDGGKYYALKRGAAATVNGVSYNFEVDLSAIAKGYACDVAESLIEESGIKGAYISLGGSSMYLSAKDGKEWSLGVVDPTSDFRVSFARVAVKDKFVATSGTYENSYITDGKVYHHIIDASVGAPAETDLASVTLIGNSGAETDALATALVIYGRERALEYLKNSNMNFVLVTNDNKVYTDLENFTLLNEAFTVEKL